VFAGTVLYALINSVILLLMAIGFNLTFGISGVANFAYGAFYILAAFATWMLMNLTWAALFSFRDPVHPLHGTLLGALMYRFISCGCGARCSPRSSPPSASAWPSWSSFVISVLWGSNTAFRCSSIRASSSPGPMWTCRGSSSLSQRGPFSSVAFHSSHLLGPGFSRHCPGRADRPDLRHGFGPDRHPECLLRCGACGGRRHRDRPPGDHFRRGRL
jgi:hypothetical protein